MGISSNAKNFGVQFKVIRGQGQIRIVCRMEVKLGGWGYRPMPNILEVSSRSSGSGVTQGQIRKVRRIFSFVIGAILAFLASVESVAVLLSPAIFQPLYASGITKNLPGAPFLFAAGLGVVAAVFAS